MKTKDFLLLGTGSVLFAFVGWKWNVPLAAWVFPVFLLEFFRRQRTWWACALALPALALASFAKFTGTWGEIIGVGVEAVISVVIAAPVLAALCVDRFFHRRAPGALSMLAFPSAYTVLDFLFGLIPGLQTGGSISVSQFVLPPVLQVASVTGIWGISFLVTIIPSAFCAWWDRGFPTGKKAAAPALAVAIACALVVVGGARVAVRGPDSPTVKAAGITVDHRLNYWDEILEKAVPREGTAPFREEFARLEDALYQRSEEAARGGARIVVWSESNLFVYEDQLPAALERAQAFARRLGICFAPAIQVLHFGSMINDSRVILITPEGRVAFTARKHISYYATDSDGVIPFANTPYGRIGAAICFDMDSPSYIRQAGRNGVDIMLVPAFDTRGGSPFHTYVGLLRAVENGFSVLRSVNHRTSMAVDGKGRVLAQQDFFSSPDGIFYSDLPTRRARTIASVCGDSLVAVAALLLVLTTVFAVRTRARKGRFSGTQSAPS